MFFILSPYENNGLPFDLTVSSICLCVCVFVCLFVPLFYRSFVRSFVDLFVHSFFLSFVRLLYRKIACLFFCFGVFGFFFCSSILLWDSVRVCVRVCA